MESSPRNESQVAPSRANNVLKCQTLTHGELVVIVNQFTKNEHQINALIEVDKELEIQSEEV